jgi:hypothetical protein
LAVIDQPINEFENQAFLLAGLESDYDPFVTFVTTKGEPFSLMSHALNTINMFLISLFQVLILHLENLVIMEAEALVAPSPTIFLVVPTSTAPPPDSTVARGMALPLHIVGDVNFKCTRKCMNRLQ